MSFRQYLRAHERFVAEEKRATADFVRNANDHLKRAATLANKVRSLTPEANDKIVRTTLGAVLSRRGTDVIRRNWPKWYGAIAQEANEFRVSGEELVRPYDERFKQRAKSFPFDADAADVLVRKKLKIARANIAGYARSNIDKYAVILCQNLDQRDTQTALLHECAHLFYHVPSPLFGSDSCDIDPLERSIDREVARALKEDAELATYVLEQVRRKGNYEGFVALRDLPKYWRIN